MNLNISISHTNSEKAKVMPFGLWNDCGIGDQEALISSLDSCCAGGQVAYLGPEASRAPTVVRGTS